ncbi:MAG TPA: sigma-70 family RNA polymerase sigma factor [Mycobacteriales bacterium]|jgi:RNA polymerase sigma factor (sigma-70 family)|nr:sigma-70 family RNA polymerase sigma factor [Mycobacteriales bacterium]
MDRTKQWRVADRHRVELVRYLTARTGAADIAEDAAAEAIAAAGSAHLRDEQHAQAWLRRVGWHRCVDEFRHRRTPESLSRVAAPSSTPSAEEVALEHDLAVRVRAAVATLPPQQRVVVTAYAQGETVRVIAARRRQTVKAVEAQLTRGLARVRDALNAGVAVVSGRLRLRRAAAVSAASMVVTVSAALWLGATIPAPAATSGAAAHPVRSDASGAVVRVTHRERTPAARPQSPAPPHRRPHRTPAVHRAGHRAASTLLAPPGVTGPAGISVQPGSVDRDGGRLGDGFVADVLACIGHGVRVEEQRVSCRPDATVYML